MSYCAQKDLTERYGKDEILQLTDREGSGKIDGDMLNSAIADADALIDTYCGTRYSVPFADNAVPAAIRKAACVIARYNLWEDAASEEVRKRYEDVVAWLKDISAGRAALDLGDDSNSGNAAPVGHTALNTQGHSNIDWSGY